MVTDEENPMLLKKPAEQKKDPLWDFSSVPSSIHPGECLTKEQPKTKWWQFWKKDGVHPYVRVHDLNNPSDDNEGRTKRPAVEIGIKGTF